MSKSQPLDKRERVEPPPRPQIPLVVWVLLAFLLGATLMYGRMNTLYLDVQEVSRGHQIMTVRARADPRDGQFGHSGEVIVLDGELQGQRLELRYGRDIVPLELGQVAVVGGIAQGLPLEASQRHRFTRGITASLTVQSLEGAHYASSPLGRLWELRASLQGDLRRQADVILAASSEGLAGDEQISAGNLQLPGSSEGKNEAYGLIAGLTYGDRRELKDSLLEGALQQTGLAHFLAVSGTHMALLGALLFFILSRTPLSRVWVSSITLLVCTCFVFFTGFAAGSIRSVLMLAFALGAYCLWRRVCVLSSMGLAGLIMLIFDPLLAVSLGFLLSFGSVAGIVIFGRYVQQWLICLVPVALRHRSKPLTNGLAIAIVAALATLPLTLEAFGILPLIGPLANLLLAPALCALLVFSFIAHFFLLILPPVGSALASACLIYSEFLGGIIKLLAQISWASIPMGGLSVLGIVLFLGGLIALWLWWPKPNRQALLRTLASVLCLVFLASGYTQFTSDFTTRNTSKTVTVLDVGQGDAMLVQDGGQTILIDAGPSPAVLRERLLEHRIHTIDLLVFTHDHADHARGAQTLGASYGIKEIIIAEGAQSSTVYQDISQRVNAPLVGALAGDVIALENIEIRFIWPLAPVRDPSANESCLIKLIVDVSPESEDANPLDVVLTSGDAEAGEVKRALSQPEGAKALMVNGQQKEVDVLKVPHHGSRNSLDEQLARMLAEGMGNDISASSNPQGGAGRASPQPSRTPIAVISVGKNNQYGHPRPEPLELIDRYFQKLYRTDKDGSVTIEL
ncbi:MAG: ComEC/Rec2 family competence protein [Coriobacteriia bacterium]|nr:ComEC/Rec2 family competence protein [Coriobacteriia bacterium]